MEDYILTGVTVLFTLFLRFSVSLNSYSGANTPPMFGDYEAQRHWMEITFNLPVEEWYEQSKNNDLLYWGLDYPPLTAYHSKLCGYVANFINPDWVALNKSRGFESYEHKLFMRYTVIVADLLIYIPAIIYFFTNVLQKESKQKQLAVSCLVLSYPGLILIDHGHFQYNCISLGLALLAVTYILKDYHGIASMFFLLALSYKQMELYHAFPFFFYLLGICWQQKSWFGSFHKLTLIGVSVIVTFTLCFLPFLGSVDSLLAVIQRLFPFNRGLFEDKVANFWCALSVVIKLKHILQQQQIVLLCMVTTLLSCVPSSINLFMYPTKKRFLYSLVNCSLSFFLFSYQVHEKSILIVALPVCLILYDSPFVSLWFLIISTISMYPLLSRDGQSSSYFALLSIFCVMSIYTFDWKKSAPITKFTFIISLCIASTIHILYSSLAPPKTLPDVYPLLFAVYSCVHFLLFWLHFHYAQLTLDNNDCTFNNLFCKNNVVDEKKNN